MLLVLIIVFPEGTLINSASERGGAVTMVSGTEVMFGSTTQDGAGYFAGGDSFNYKY